MPLPRQRHRISLLLAAALLSPGVRSEEADLRGAPEPPRAPERSPDPEGALTVWHQRLTGSIQGLRDNRSGVGLVQRDGDSSLGMRLRLGRWRLGFTRLNHEAVGTAVRSLTFRGVVFAQPDAFRLSHRFSFVDVFHDLEIRDLERLGVQLELGFKLTKIRTQLLNTRSQEIASIHEQVPVPHLGLRTRFGPADGLHGFLRAHFTELSHDDVGVRMGDYALGVETRLGARLRAALGWRRLYLEVDVRKRPGREGLLDFRNDGPYFELARAF